MRKRLKSRLIRSAAVASLLEHLENRTLFAVAQPTNPGFEVPSVGNGSYGAFQYNPSGASWSFTNLSGTNGSGISGNGSGFTAQNPNAPEGTQVGFVQGTGSITQSVTFTAGTYAIGFDAAQRIQYQNGLQNFEVLVDGNVVGTFTPAAGGAYATYESNAFTVSAGSHSIEFLGLDSAGGDHTAFVDAVHVDSVQPGVPANAGFETPSVGSGTYSSFQYNPSGATWTFTPLSGTNGSGISGNGSGFTSGNPNAPEGTQVGFVQGTGSISQSVALPAGSYEINLDAAQRVNWQASHQDFEVLVDGNVVGTFTPGGGGAYEAYQTNPFTVSGSGSHTITIQGLDSAGGDNTAFVDSVKVLNTTTTPPPPPPPPTGTLTVGPGQEYATIQAGINASSSGDTIDVYSGTYTEQDTIPLGLDNLTVEAGPGQTVTIKAPSTLVAPGAIFRIEGQNDTLQGFTITGPGSTSGALNYGVLVDNGGSATIQNNHVTKIEDSTFASSQTGYGIAVIDGSANVTNNIVDNYQKAGILIGLPSSITGSSTWQQSGDVENNTVTGVGATTLITQNGIEFVGPNATGTAKGNNVSGNTYTGPVTTGNAAGILLYDAGNSITVMNNVVFRNDTNIVVNGGLNGNTTLNKSDFAIVSGNTVYQATYYDGIDLLNGTSGDQVSNNDSFNNFDGIFIDQSTGGNTISSNTFSGNSDADIDDQTYSASNNPNPPSYGTYNMYYTNSFHTSNDGLIPST